MNYAARRTPHAALDAAYAHCWRIATSHYENFTVGSWLLPKPMRRHIAAIYAFARIADDMADEGEGTSPQRLAQLDEWERRLEDCYRDRAEHPVFIALAQTAAEYDVPIDPFRKLLRAF